MIASRCRIPSVIVPDFSSGPAPDLESGDVAVYVTSLDVAPLNLKLHSDTLSPDELLRARQHVAAVDRDRFIAGRGILRAILSHHTGTPPSDIAFTYGPAGKPALANPVGSDLQFNMSHSSGLAVYALARGQSVGVDIERMNLDPKILLHAMCFLSPVDLEALTHSLPDVQFTTFFTLWTRTESLVKATGVGITALPNSAHLDAWTTLSFTPAPGYAAALTTPNRALKIRFFRHPY
jgi:4'-phosphopantetheinyl transferase